MRPSRLLLIVCLGLSVIAGCAKHRPHPGPPDVTVLPPVGQEQGEGIQPGESFSVAQAESIRRIHYQMMNEAQDHLARQEMDKAIMDLQRLLALRPEPELEIEGRWMLAQAYRKTGQWEGARDQYRVLASTPGETAYQSDARRNFQELDALLEQARMPPQDTQAIRLRLAQIPDSGGFDEGIKRMREDGVTTLLIDLECREGNETSQGPVVSRSVGSLADLHTLLRSFVSRSHLQDLRIFVGIDPRCAGNWKNPVPMEWKDRTYDRKGKVINENRFFDLFHPDYQEFLLDFFTRIGEDGVDGIVFLGDHPISRYDGVSPQAIQAFQNTFQVRFTPSEEFDQSLDPWEFTSRPSSGKASPEASLVWRWSGWKARERLSVLEKIFHHLRRQFLTLQVGLEIHPHGLTDPVRALVDYAEDAMEATVRPFSFFYVRPEIDRQAAYEQKAAIDKLRRISTKAILTRLLPAVDNPRRVWVSFPADGRKRINTATGMESSVLKEFPSGIGVVHDLRAFS